MSEPEARSYPVIDVAEYDARWPSIFADAAADIARFVPDGQLRLEHIGSTAVPGLSAKPIIDMLGAIDGGLGRVREIMEPLALAGFEYVDKGRSDRHFFRRGAWGRGTHHLHIVEYLGQDWVDQIAFRDWLRQHPADAVTYEELKRSLAAQHGRDRPGYKVAKTQFIRGIVAKATGGRSGSENLPAVSRQAP